MTSLLAAALLSSLVAQARPLRVVVAPPPPPVVVVAAGPARPDMVWVPGHRVRGGFVPGHWQRVGPPPRVRPLPPAVVAYAPPPPPAPRVLVRATSEPAAVEESSARALAEEADAPLAIPAGE